MLNSAILEKLDNLPTYLQNEVLHFIEFLAERHLQTPSELEEQGRKPSLFGVWKGEIAMADDFDAPLEDMKDYM